MTMPFRSPLRLDQAATTGARVALSSVTRSFHTGDGQTLIAVDAVDLEIEQGAVVALTGASGSGKSTLLHLVGALDKPTSGHVEVDGQDLATMSRRRLADYRRSVGFVFQRFNLLPALTVLDNVVAPVLPYRVPYDKHARARELLTQVGLANRASDAPHRLSGGQQQRVAIARALINQPRLLLADEPTGNLDSRTGTEILALLMGMRDLHGVTIIIATHDQGIADRADRRITLIDGHLASV
jgi:putative ABC transport system ATP-binding protein